MKGASLILIFVSSIFLFSFISANSALVWNETLIAYEIHNCIELQNMSLNLSGTYALVNNINCSDTVNWNEGQGFVPIGYYEANTWVEYPFTGSLEGRGFSISNLYMDWNEINGTYLGGLFGYTSGALVSNFSLYDLNITVFHSEWGSIGGVAGFFDGGSIVGVSSTGFIAGDISSDYSSAGGLVGELFGSIFSSYSNANVTGFKGVGGLAGYSPSSSSISNSYATGSVEGNTWVGGLVGNNGGNISNSYSIGVVVGSLDVGGLVGYDGFGNVSNSYWDINTSGQAISEGGEGKTTEEMKISSTFIGWNTNIWNLTTGYYPTLFRNSSSSSNNYLVNSFFSEGNGTIENPYQIKNWTQLNATKQNLSAHYILMNHLTAEDSDYDGLGNNWTPIGNYEMTGLLGDLIGYFSGSFNGQGFNIKNLEIYGPFDYSDYYSSLGDPMAGLFGYSIGNISNLNLTIDYISMDYGGAAGIVGYNKGFVRNSTVIVNYSSFSDSGGGFVGLNNGSILDSSAYILYSLNSPAPASIAGFVGFNYGLINNSASFVYGSLSSQILTAGFVSDNRGNISHSNSTIYGSARLQNIFPYGSQGASAFVGSNSGQILNCFSTVDDSATLSSSYFSSMFVVSQFPPQSLILDSYGKIVNLDNGTLTFVDWNVSKLNGDLLNSVSFYDNLLSIDSDLKGLEVGANVSLRCSENIESPVILKDGVECVDCNFFSKDDSHYLFSIENAGNYSVSNSVSSEVFSSGSGSSGKISLQVSESSLENGFIRNLRKGDLLKFNLNNQTHNLTVNNISNNSLTITIQSIPQIFTMKQGDVLNVDVNFDGFYDLEVSYLKYFTNVVSLKVKAVSIKYEVSVVKNETNVTAPFGIDKEGPTKDGINNSILFLFFSAVLFLVFIFMVIKIVLVLKNTR